MPATGGSGEGRTGRRGAVVALLSAALSVAPGARAEAPRPERGIEVHADLQNLVLLRNDADFDRTLPLYREQGRAVGALATLFRPEITFRIGGGLRLFYQAELGLNHWGKQSPDQQSHGAPDAMVMKHRELWGEGEALDGRFGFKAGYVRLAEPTGLFVNHWVGAGQVRWAFAGELGAEAFLGQLPDQIHEGLDVGENNFRRDIFVGGLATRLGLAEGRRLSAALTGLYDDHRVGRSRMALCASLRLEGRLGPVEALADLGLQGGRLEGAALGGGDQRLLAFAAQGRAQWTRGRLALALTALALSPDDDFDGNDRSGGFLYSGKSASATLLLTEDEIRDWYDNLDERMSSHREGFFVNRAGLLVADVKASWAVTEALRPGAVVGVARTLNPANSLGAAFVGVETDLLLEYRLSEHLEGQLAAGALFPGRAGAALINRIDMTRTDPLFSFEGSLRLRY